MSSKAKEKYGNINVPAQSLHPPDKDGYLTKQGGSIKSWKRRYFILKGHELYYYKTPKDQVFTGRITLEPTSVVKEEKNKKKSSNMFSITTTKRIYFIFADKPEEVKEWVEKITMGIECLGGEGGKSTVQKEVPHEVQNSNTTPNSIETAPNSTSTASKEASPSASAVPTPSAADMSPRVRLSLAKQVIPFLKEEDSKVLEFWQIWSESIPAKEEISPGGSIQFNVATSADMCKITWRTSGPQNIFIQKMVDFFWNVGAPESEIDRLNDVGAMINPVRIGSWIDMSSKGGMDGGWYFPVEVPLKSALDSADSGDAVNQFSEWANAKDISQVYVVGRDMGAAPPRQTEFRLKLTGADFDAQLESALDAFSAFNFPSIPSEALNILKSAKSDGTLHLSVITSSEGFVRLGLLVPHPSTETVLSLCEIAGGKNDEIASFEGSLGVDGPAFVEYQYLQKGFGYGVYKEGFDIVFHYIVGEDSC